jgi:hypothetical protein
MSDTPRTDAVLECVDGDPYLIEPTKLADFAREIERELAWLRSGGNLPRSTYRGVTRLVVAFDTVEAHLASKPPENWKP